MDESTATELRELRARAYGPDADLHDDAAAIARLQELEELSRAVPDDVGSPSPDEPSVALLIAAADEPRASPRHAEPASAVPLDEDATLASRGEASVSGEAIAPGERSSFSRTGGRRRSAIVLIAAVVAAVVVTAAVTGVVSRRVQADPRELAVLGVDPAGTIPQMFQGWQCNGGDCLPGAEAEGTVFNDFYGLTAFTIPGQLMGPQGSSECLMVMETADMDTEGDSFSGPLYSGCGAGGFPAAIVLPVTAELPAELRAEFPEGSGLQFVLEGSEVVVLGDEP